MSFLSESAAPRDFKISTTESEGRYTKCLLCYTIKKNFYCVECIKAGNFIHSLNPYSDRFADKQLKLLRVKANRQHIVDRCETFLKVKDKKDQLAGELEETKEKIRVLKLALGQTARQVKEHRHEAATLRKDNAALKAKLPRYQKRVAALSKHVESMSEAGEGARRTATLAATRLAARRADTLHHLFTYIFPIHISYTTRDSMETELEFLRVGGEAYGAGGASGGGVAAQEGWDGVRVHVGAPSLPADLAHCGAEGAGTEAARCEGAVEGEGGCVCVCGDTPQRAQAALCMAAQLLLLLAYTLHVPLPRPAPLSEVWLSRWGGGGGGGGGGAAWEVWSRRVSAWAVRVGGAQAGHAPCARRPRAALPAALLALYHHAQQHAQQHARLHTEGESSCGGVEGEGGCGMGVAGGAMSVSVGEAVAAWEEAWPSAEPPPAPCAHAPDPAYPDWDNVELCEVGEAGEAGPGAVQPSLVSSAAASLVSMLRHWTK